MFSNILDCPECKHRFMFDVKGKFPEKITCPSCHKSTSYKEYSALVLCSNCRQKLKIKLEDLESNNVACPLCGEHINTSNIINKDNELNTYAENSSDVSNSNKRMLQDGEFFDKFKILSFLGKGGMAEVYLAEHLLLKKKCAIKIMSASGGNDQIFIKRFIREAKIAHSIDNPHIVSVFDAGCDFKTGHMFIAMDYVDGKNLIEISSGRKMSEKALLDILHTVASALKVLHENHIVHRDIKPSNIMRTKDGVYKLMDLGIAKSNADHQAGEMTLTMDRQTIGTPSYASPEQCQSAHTADIRSDIYSLGATLYHLATGRIPYSGTTTVEIILKVIKHDLVPLKTLRPDLSRGMTNLIEAMMRSNPDERPQTPDALLKFANSRRYREEGFKSRMVDFVKSIPETVMDIPTKLGRISTKIKTVTSANEIPFATEKSSLSFKDYFLKYLTLAAMIAITALLLAYIRFEYSGEKYSGVKDVSFFRYAISGFKKPEVKVAPKFSLRNRYRLMTYPDPERLYSFRKEIFFSDAPAHAPDRKFDFSKPETITHQAWKQRCKDGALFLSPEDTDLENAAYQYEKQNNGYAISVTLTPDTMIENMVLFSFGNITVCKRYNNYNIVILVQNNQISLNMPQKETVNISWSVDVRKRLLTVFSDKMLIGRYLLPDNFFAATPRSNALQFTKKELPEFKNFSGKIHLIEFWDAPRYFSTKPISNASLTISGGNTGNNQKETSSVTETEKKSTETAQQEQASTTNAAETDNNKQQAKENTAPSQPQTTDTTSEKNPPEQPVKLNQKRTIAVRLQECRDRLQKVQDQNDYIMKDETIAFIKAQIAELEKQTAIRKRVLAAKNNQYSEEQTKEFIKELKKCYRHKRFYINKNIVDKFNNPNIDPNAHFTINDQKMFLADTATVTVTLSSYNIFSNFKNLLIAKNVDVNLADFHYIRERIFFNLPEYNELFFDLFMFGMDDIDSGTYPPAFNMLYRLNVFNKTGLHISDERLCKFLLLAPYVNAVTPNGETLMHFAAKFNLPNLAKTLYLAGFTAFDKRDTDGHSPWDTALKFGSRNVVAFLESIEKTTEKSSYTKSCIELFQFIRDKNNTYLTELLQSGKCDVHAIGYHGLTAIEYACCVGNIGALQAMQKCNIDITKTIKRGTTSNFGYPYTSHPLHIAVANADMRTFIWLLENGFSTCDVRLINVQSLPSRILMYLEKNLKKGYYDTPVDEQTVINMFRAIVKYDKKINFNNDSIKSYNVLFRACLANFKNRNLKLELIKLLLENKATMDKKQAARIDDPAIRYLLKKHGIL